MPDYRQYQSGNQSFITSPDFPAEDYGAAPIDPSAPFGSVDSVPQSNMSVGPGPVPGGPPPPPPPEVPVNAGGMSAPPEQAPAGPAMSRAPVQISPVSVQGDPYGADETGMAPARPVDPNSLDALTLLTQYGKVKTGGRAEQQAIPEHWQNAQRSGFFDPAEQRRLEQESLEGQRDASYQQSAAQLMQNDAEVEALKYREAQIDMMRQEAAAKQRAIQDNVQRDRTEYEALKRDYQTSRRNDAQRGAFGTVPGALSTIFGMLAIGLAAKGKRENLDATINAVQGAVDRQVQAMRNETAAKGADADNAYARYMKTYNNADQAEAATKALLNDHAAAEIDRMMAQSKDPLIAAQGAEARAQMQANSNRYLGDLDRASEGNTVQAWNLGQKYRAASRGGLRDATADEIMKGGKFLADNESTRLGSMKTGAEISKLRNETTGADPAGMDAETFSKYSGQLERLEKARTGLAKTNALLDQLDKSGDKSFAGMAEDSWTPFTGRARATIAQTFSGDANDERAAFNDAIGDVMFARFGAGNKEQKQSAAEEILTSYDKESVRKNLIRMRESAEQAIKEVRSSLPTGVDKANLNRRDMTGATQATVAQPGRVIPGG